MQTTPISTSAPNALNLRCMLGATLTRHAQQRMSHRHVSPEAIDAALSYGTAGKSSGAWIFRLGDRDVARALQQDGVDLEPFLGTHVVVASNGKILTTWKNRSLRRLKQ